MRELRSIRAFGMVLLLAGNARGQYYSRQEALEDRAAAIRWEATSQKRRADGLQRRSLDVRAWRVEVDDWARSTRTRGAELDRESKAVDRAVFFAQQQSAINQANLQQVQTQSQEVFASAQQVSLRHQQLRSYQHQLTQWKALLDQQEAELQKQVDAGWSRREAKAEDARALADRTDAQYRELREAEDALKQRQQHLETAEKELAARRGRFAERMKAVEESSTSLDADSARNDARREALDTMDASLDEMKAALDRMETSLEAIEEAAR